METKIENKELTQKEVETVSGGALALRLNTSSLLTAQSLTSLKTFEAPIRNIVQTYG